MIHLIKGELKAKLKNAVREILIETFAVEGVSRLHEILVFYIYENQRQNRARTEKHLIKVLKQQNREEYKIIEILEFYRGLEGSLYKDDDENWNIESEVFEEMKWLDKFNGKSKALKYFISRSIIFYDSQQSHRAKKLVDLLAFIMGNHPSDTLYSITIMVDRLLKEYKASGAPGEFIRDFYKTLIDGDNCGLWHFRNNRVTLSDEAILLSQDDYREHRMKNPTLISFQSR